MPGLFAACRRRFDRTRRLVYEPLEDRRLLAAVITVNSVMDSNLRDDQLSLREAILVNNRTLDVSALTIGEQAQVVGTPSAADADTIAFNIPGSGVHTISPTSALPTITDPVIIDGYTQPGTNQNSDPKGFNGQLYVELNGTNAGNSNGLYISAGFSTVRGLVINRFQGGITGTGMGIRLDGGDGNVIAGNLIGTDATGSADFGNTGHGILIQNSRNNLIGGNTPADRNVISGNSGSGVTFGASPVGGTVSGNFLGTDITGSIDLGNTDAGISVFSDASAIVIGGLTAGARNIISGNDDHGVEVNGGHSVVIEGNYIGTDVTGTKALPNSIGIALLNTNLAVVGGLAGGAGNLISANKGVGIQLSRADQSLIQGNLVGTGADGTSNLGNGASGIALFGTDINSPSANNRIEQNTIAFNSSSIFGGGINIQQGGFGGSVGNAFLQNAIFSNTGLGIDLNRDGITANDLLPTPDADTGPNKLQNFPVVSAVTISGGQLSTTYSVPSATSNAAYPLRIEFFRADSDGQEGQVFLGFDTYTAAEAGTTKTSTITPAAIIAAGGRLVATATDNIGNTSEFSASQIVTGPDQPPVITSNDGGASAAINVFENTTAVTDVDATDPDPGSTLTYGISGGADAAKFTINALTGLLRFKTPPNFENPTDVGRDNVYDVIVRVSDGILTDTQSIAVTVTNVYEPPTITSDGGGTTASISLPENTLIATDVNATHDTGTPIVFSISGGADAPSFAISATTGLLQFIAAPNFESPSDVGSNNVYDVVVQVSDGVSTDTQAIAIGVTNSNDSPTALPDEYSTSEDEPIVILPASGVLANDTDEDAGDSKSVVAVAGGGVVWDEASDGDLPPSGTLPVFLLAPGVNEIRGTTGDPFNAPSDLDGFVIQVPTGFQLTSALYSVARATGAIRQVNWSVPPLGSFGTIVPLANFSLFGSQFPLGAGQYTFREVSFSKESSGNSSDLANYSFRFNVTGEPAVGRQLTLPSGALLTMQADGSFQYDPNGKFESLPFGQAATDSFTYTVADSQGALSLSRVTITIQGANDAPTGTDKTVTMMEDTAVTFQTDDFGFSDPDTPASNFLAVQITTLPTAGTLTVDGSPASAGQVVPVSTILSGQMQFTPAANANGSPYTSFTFQVQDDGGTANGGLDLDPSPNTLTINVSPVNDAPVAVDDSYSTSQGTPLTVPPPGVLENDSDVDGDSLSAALATVPSHGTVTLNADGSFTFTPDSTFSGTDTFSYTVSDGNGGTATAAVSIDVTPAAPASVLSIVDSCLGGTALLITGTSADDEIVVEPGSSPTTLTVTINGVASIVPKPSGRIIVTGGDGNDEIQIVGSVANPAWLYGDAGNDRLNAGNDGSLLIGGEGDDRLSGGSGRDVLIGGQGADNLIGSSADDILVASSTTKDGRSTAGHEDFWCNVLAEWNSANAFATRVQNLRDGTGGSAHNNGSYLLPNVVDSVFADGELDILIGGAGSDWLIYLATEDQVMGAVEASN